MPSTTECIARLRKIKPDITDAEIEAAFDDVDNILTRTGHSGQERHARDLIKDKSYEAYLQALILKRDFLANRAKAAELLASVEGAKTPGDGVSETLAGSNTPRAGKITSVETRQKAIEADLASQLVEKLDKAGLTGVFARGELDRQISMEMFEMRPGGTPGISGSKDARKIAEILKGINDQSLRMLNDAGAFIRNMDGYIVKQSHSQDKLRRSTFDEWLATIEPLLDPRTFDEMAGPQTPARRREFLQEIHTALASGIHIKSTGDSADALSGFKGPGNLAKKISQGRVIHFRNGAAWHDYNAKYGVGNLSAAVMYGIRNTARSAGLMRVYGTNPQNAFETLLTKLRETHRSNSKFVASLESSTLRWQMAVVDGTVDQVGGSATFAAIAHTIRSVQSMAKLGMASLSSFADFGLAAGELRFQGSAGGRVSSLKGMASGRRSTEFRAAADSLGVGLDGTLGHIASRFSTEGDVPGRMSKMMTTFFKLNGLQWWTDSLKRGVGVQMAYDLAVAATRTFDAMDPKLRGLLQQYDINAREWDVIRQAPLKMADGRRYLSPDGIADLSDDVIANYLGRTDASASTLRRTRDDLSQRLRGYIMDRVDYAVITPGVRERAYMTVGKQRGTIGREMVQTLMQFKGFPLSVIMRTLGREVYGRGNWKKGVAPIVGLMVELTALGYIADSAKRVFKGEEPRDPRLWKTVLASSLQGGGLGLFGDYLFADLNRYGSSALSSIAGPTFGTINDLMGVLSGLTQEGEFQGAKLARLGINNTPFINLFYTRAALNYLFLYQIQESLSPGYLGRTEDRLNEQGSGRLWPMTMAFD